MNSQESLYTPPGDGSRRVRKLQAKRVQRLELVAGSSKKVLGYVRVSTEEQATTGHGMEAQQRAIRLFAESQGYELVDLVNDAGVSGSKKPSDRTGFRRVLELAKARAFSILLVWKFDRLARNLLYSVTTVHDLKTKYDVVLRSITEPIDTSSPMGEMIFTLLAGFAAEERRTIIRRTLSGKREKADKGGFSGGAAPLGYARDREGGLVIVDEESRAILQIFQMHAEKMPLRAMAKQLNAEGVPTKRGGQWHAGTIRYILDNPKYRGFSEYYFRWEEDSHLLREGAHEPIVPRAA